jgi:hypothetical protein
MRSHDEILCRFLTGSDLSAQSHGLECSMCFMVWALKAMGLSAQGSWWQIGGLAWFDDGWVDLVCLGCLGSVWVIIGWFQSSSNHFYKLRVVTVGRFHHRERPGTSQFQNRGVYSCPSWTDLDTMVWYEWRPRYRQPDSFPAIHLKLQRKTLKINRSCSASCLRTPL